MKNPWRQPDLGESCQREEPKRCRSDAGQGWGKQVPRGTSPKQPRSLKMGIGTPGFE